MNGSTVWLAATIGPRTLPMNDAVTGFESRVRSKPVMHTATELRTADATLRTRGAGVEQFANHGLRSSGASESCRASSMLLAAQDERSLTKALVSWDDDEMKPLKPTWHLREAPK